MTNRARAAKAARPDKLASLLALAPSLPGPWFTRGANIALARVAVRAANTDWIADVHVLAGRNSRTDPVEYEVVLTMFCNKAPRSEKGQSELRAWQQRITKQLRALGYEGRWQTRAPGGPLVNYFSKNVARLAQLPAAVRKLQQVRF